MALHVIKSPRPSLAIFHTGSDGVLAVGTAWERGYVSAILHFMAVTVIGIPFLMNTIIVVHHDHEHMAII